jgi:phage repressor protein C with HTH and peptisase S24 domain
MAISEKLKERRKVAGLTQVQLANQVEASEMTVRRWENGERAPNSDMLLKIALVLKTSVAYLMGERDSPDRIESKSLAIADDSADTPNFPDKEIISLPESNVYPVMAQKMLPIIDQEACAGRGFDYADALTEVTEWMPWPIESMGGAHEPLSPYFVRVQGDSMEGVGILDGALILVNPNVDIINGNPAYVEWCGMRSIKGFIEYPDGRVELRPANPNYQAVHISAEDASSENFRVLGKVVRWINEGIPKNVV